MESKIREMLELRLLINRHALMRHLYIDADNFQMAMYHQLMFLSHSYEFGALKNSATAKENANYWAAMLCWDYK
jgi:hypothetical protein